MRVNKIATARFAELIVLETLYSELIKLSAHTALLAHYIQQPVYDSS
jgi:hypothetical protein